MVKLLHFSDVHLTAEKLGWRVGDAFGKRATGWVNVRLLGRGHRFRHANPVAAALVAEWRARKPDHLVFTGDATTLAFEAEMAAALERPYHQAQRHVRAAKVKYVDETGWRRAGRWLWTAATRTAACFRIGPDRNVRGLQDLLGTDVFGTVVSDRYGVYNRLKPARRAVCWAHLKRDFQRWLERGGPTKRLGAEGLKITKRIFHLWHRFRVGTLTRRTLRQLLRPLRRRLKALVRWGATRDGSGGRRGTGVKASHFCRNLLAVEPALWTFARRAGVEPTNNHAERVLRPGVMWRKTSFGSHSDGGCRYAERMLTAVQTLRLQHCGVVDYLTQALDAHRRGVPAPSLL